MNRSNTLIKTIVLALVISIVATVGPSTASGQGRRRARLAAICGNPKLPCKTSVTFQPYDLPFRLPENAVIWESEFFYAVVLKSMKASYEACDVFIPETERLAAQELFPEHKVFASRCIEPGELFYVNVSDNYRIMAVYAGSTMSDAKRLLVEVKATGKFPGAYIRRTRTGFNGT